MSLTPDLPKTDDIVPMFTRRDGDYHFSRWERPIVPVVFGVDDDTLATVKAAIEAIVVLAGHKMAETDPEQGANFMIFFFRDWKELREVPDLDRLVDGLHDTIDRLDQAGANRFTAFRFEEDGAIRACFAFIRMDETMQSLPAETVALSLATRSILFWSEQAFDRFSALAHVDDDVTEDGLTIVHPAIALVIRAGYDPMMPVYATDPSHAMRMDARIGVLAQASV